MIIMMINFFRRFPQPPPLKISFLPRVVVKRIVVQMIGKVEIFTVVVIIVIIIRTSK